MPDQIYIGNYLKGQRTDRTTFNIDNDAFPLLFNFYSWRGRIKRKRGTETLGRLAYPIKMVTSPTLPWQKSPITITSSSANLKTFISATTDQTIVPGSISILIGATTYTDPNKNGTLSGGSGGTINYATGAITFTGVGNTTGTGSYSYYPDYPVMGLRDFTSTNITANFPQLVAFDTHFAYECNQAPVNASFYSVSYYKTTQNIVQWSGGNYQQFWTTNYPSTTTNQSGSLWATNNKPGFNFVNGSYTSGSGTTTVTLNFKSNTVNFTSLIVGDQLWFNEWTGSINGNVGSVSDISGAASGNYVVTFSSSVTVSGTGIAQLLTNSIAGQDGIKWYDGDPTGGSGFPIDPSVGWVNFAPPLTASTVSIANLPLKKYYLVGALAILPFKDRLLFFSPYVQTSEPNTQAIQLQDTVIWSWNGTPYYNSIVPLNQTYDVRSYYVDQTGFGGWLSAGISQPIQTVSNNEDVLLVGFGGNGRKTRFTYTGNDIQPFLFFSINSELPSNATFSSVALDKGALDMGSYGFAITDQQSSQRIDLDIPESVFDISLSNNGAARISAIRDFTNEWVYFSFVPNNSQWTFPTQSFLFNYRDNTWAVLYENFTCHGNYRAGADISWATLPYSTWEEWTDPWNSGTFEQDVAQIIAGNPQGYVLIKDVGTGEGNSGAIVAISKESSSDLVQITSYNHCLASSNPVLGNNDFIYITGCIGTTYLNNTAINIVKIIDANNFVINIVYDGSFTYGGNGQYSRLSQPLLQTKSFPFYWEQGRQVRLGAQRYLLDYTYNGQVTLNIYLSQDDSNPWNNQLFAGNPNGLVYSQILYTCPESTNIGLTPANTNLQQLVAQTANQIWHRVNTSLIGDSFQIGITLSNEQMLDFAIATDEIVLHGMHFNVSPSSMLA